MKFSGSGKKDISGYLSNKITHLMFGLSILVVYIHMYSLDYENPSFYVANVLQDIWSQGFCRVSVPVFFMISGYLHFSRSELSAKTLVQAFHSKITGLIIPYLIWNVIYLLFYTGIELFLRLPVKIINPIYIIKGVLFYGCNPAFWYVFQLILLFALSPLLLKLIYNKKRAIGALVVFFIMYLLIHKNTKWFLLPGLLFFSLGAVCAVHFRDAVDKTRWSPKMKRIVPVVAIAAFVGIMVWRVLLMDLSANISDLRHTIPYRLFECLVAVVFWYAVDIVDIGNWAVHSWERHSFLVYAIHWMAIEVANIVIPWVVDITPVSRVAVYILVPGLIVACILIVATALKKFLPSFYRFVSGGR